MRAMADEFAWLREVNPEHRERPEDDCVAFYQQRVAAVSEFAARVNARARLAVPIVVDWPQDATMIAALVLPTGWCREGATGSTTVRFSHFARLFTVLGEGRLREDDRAWVLRTAAELDLCFVPEAVFADRGERFNGDLFNQLFDYV